jgi:glyoxylase-like metal-dependent hydrolase (beta-lactamase superfamily II)
MPVKKPRKTKKKKSPVDAGNIGKTAGATGVTVRMFCHGLGDSFLVTIPQVGTRPYAILIDCGIAMGTAAETELMKRVAAKIADLTKDASTGKSTIDLLVVTHEHRDHVSGFIQAEQELAQIEFKKVWLAWTENRQDELANELRLKHAKEKATLVKAFAIARSLAASPSSTRLLKGLSGVLAFNAVIPAAKGKKVDVASAMAAAGKLGKSGEAATLLPGKVLPLPGATGGTAAGVQAFVLGPPHDGTKLRRINPSKKTPETYEKATAAKLSLASLGMSRAWAAAMSARGVSTEADSLAAIEAEQAMPFDAKWRRDLKAVEKTKEQFFQRAYFATDSIRRIDADWLWSGAQRLALYMDTYTNNTSLALAFELPKSKKVLLFAADAQVGNWLSWYDADYKTTDGRTLTASHLLANTVLYKVGHHGSHNATLRQKGLEVMSHPELVAMLPVEKVAVDRLGYGEMPLISLLKELDKRTEGRILHLDQEWTGGKAPGKWRAGMIKARLSSDTFEAGANGRALYMEYTIPDAASSQG